MTIHRIESFDELLTLTPAIVKEKRELGNVWAPENITDFSASLFANFSQGFYFGEAEGDKLLYLCCILPQGNENVHFWLFYVSKELYGETLGIVAQLKSYFRDLGFSKVTTSTNRNQGSYRRWVKKFGLSPVYTTYEGDI